MKTKTVNGIKCRQVAEKSVTSCEGCVFESSGYHFCEHIQCDVGHFILKKVDKNHKISFYRYHRLLDRKTGFAKSNMGVTFFVKINYRKRTMRVSCSVCNGDNFSKERGKIQASTRYDFGRYLEFPLNDYVNSQESVLDYLRLNLDDECHLPEFEAAVKQLRRMYAK